MVLSLVVVLGVIAIIMVIAWRPQPEAIKAVEYQPIMATAQKKAGFEILSPEPMQAGWTVTSARWEISPTSSPDAAWHIGMVTSDEQYVAVDQSATERPEWLAGQVNDLEPVGPREIYGVTWQLYERKDPVQRLMVSVNNGVTTIVSGTLNWDELAAFSSTLR